MKANTKSSARSHREQRLAAKDFLWHFDLAWRDRFEHDHWWLEKPKEQISLEASMWELFRRHPMTLRNRIKHEQIVKSNSAIKQGKEDVSREHQLFLSTYCCSSWQHLDAATQELWRIFLSEKVTPQHGFYPCPVTVLNHQLHGDCWDEEIWLSRSVKQFHKKGGIIIAIDPDAFGTGKLVEQIVHDWPRHEPVKKGKSRHDQWCNVIDVFEREEKSRISSKAVRNDQWFARYRRIINNWSWPS